MKKALGATVLLCLLVVIACNKNKDKVAPGVPAQTWSFKSLTYNTSECFTDTVHNNLNLSANNAANDSATGYCALTCFFYGNTLPTTNGTYTVALVNAPDSTITATQVTFRLVLGDSLNNYMSTGGNGHETVSVSVNNGMLSITGTGIEMAHYNSSFITDSAALSFNLTQTQ